MTERLTENEGKSFDIYGECDINILLSQRVYDELG